MRRLISTILILMIFISSFTVSFAGKSLDKVLLKENGKGSNYQVVNIKIDGKTVQSEDVPPVIYPLNNQGRTLVPLRMIIDQFGDRLNADIEWDQSRQEAKIETSNKTIVLKIDSPDAIVNGVKKRLPDGIPAKLLAIGNYGRTMVPIRFFAEELGLKVGWDEKTNTALIDFPKMPEEEGKLPPTKPGDSKEPSEDIGGGTTEEAAADITDIQVNLEGAMPQIRIKTSKEIDYKEFKLIEPERLVLDLNNAKFKLSNKNKLEANGTLDIKTDNEIVKRVRVSQFEKDPYITRAVVELGSAGDYEIRFDKKTNEIVVDFINYIYRVKKEVINAKEVVLIEGDFIEDYNIMELSNPRRIVVDIKDSNLHNSFKTRTMNVDSKVVKTIRISQYMPEYEIGDGKAVRIVVDLNEDFDSGEEPYIEVEDNKLKVHLEGEPFKSIRYEEISWTNSKFALEGLVSTRYDVDRQLASNTIHISVPKTDIELEPINLDVNDHIIKTITIDEDRHNYNLELELQEGVDHRLLSPEHGKDLILELNNKDAKYREILIVIDPGHGGSDPGTISTINKAKESEIVLDISLKFNKLLTEAGFRTYMTRVDNLNSSLKLSLQERTDIANMLDADLFVSVHANSFTGNSISGIETFYFADDRQGKTLAQFLQSELIDELKMIDRGAKSANYYVLKHTNMPSALVETGFLSNPSDAAKLVTEQYQDQVAKALFKGLVEYLENTKQN